MSKEKEQIPENLHSQDSPQGQEPKAEETSKAEAAEHSQEQAEEEYEQQVDYSNFSKEQLLTEIEKLVEEDQLKQYEKVLNELRDAYDEYKNSEREQALEKFVAEGGDKDAFDYKGDETDQRFEKAFRTLRERRAKYYSELEKNRDHNLKAKQSVLDRLRELVDSPETNTSNAAIKKLQEEWKSIGQVPAATVKELWANYNALLDRFYNNRSIYFELKELDRRKNLEAKLELCKKAEQLEEVEEMKQAVAQLNDLHEEFKFIGPVPREEQEPLWQRFKTASDKVYEKRRAHIEEMKKDLQANLEVKKQLIEEVKPFGEFSSDRIKEWNSKTKEMLAVQQKWEAVGGVPREQARDINRQFWGVIKAFFKNKSAFFKELEAERGENLKQKEVLLEKAEELKDSEDLVKTTGIMKSLQADWKKIGPVPEKQRGIYDKFKAACDHFFNRKREAAKETEQEFEENFNKKQTVCDEIEKLAGTAEATKQKLEELSAQFRELGMVPKDKMRDIQNRYQEVVDKYVESIEGISEEEKQTLKLKTEFGAFQSDPSARRKMQNKEGELRKRIGDIENDINTWKTNLEFFASSPTAEKLRKDFEEKIGQAQQEVKGLKQQLKMLRNI